MGQYYMAINLDKREYLSPTDGAKLLEVTSVAKGVPGLVMLLTATGNGSGMSGEIYRETFEGDKDYEPRSFERILDQFTKPKLNDKDVEKTRRIIVPEFVGRWAGDRIVHAGDYTEAYRFMTKVEQLRCVHHSIIHEYNSHNDRLCEEHKRGVSQQDFLLSKPVTRHVNIHYMACVFFKEINSQVKEQLDAFGYGISQPEELEEWVENVLQRRLLRQYTHSRSAGKKGKYRRIYNLSWMSFDDIDSFLIRWENPKDFRRCIAWLKKQDLLPWQKELITHYKYNGRPAADTFARIIEDAGFDPKEIWSGKGEARLLPDKEYLTAALTVSRKAAEGNTVETGTLIEKSIAEVSGVRTRERRVIDLR